MNNGELEIAYKLINALEGIRKQLAVANQLKVEELKATEGVSKLNLEDCEDKIYK